MNTKLLLGTIGVLIIGTVILLINNGVLNKNSNQAGSSNIITASFYPMYFFTSQIVQDKVQVINLTPAGAEPHDYELSTQDRAKIEQSKLLVLNGGGLEPWGDKIQEDVKGKNIKVVIAGEDLASREIEEEGQKIVDPHVWLSPPLAKKQTEKILQGLIDSDSANAAFYKEKAKELEVKLDNLDEEYKKGLSNCQKKDIVTSHAAFGYLASEYSLNQVAISGLSPDEEPSAKQLADTAKFVRDNNIKYIFFESLVSPKLAETLAAETGAQTLVLDPIEGISDDEIKSGRDYFSVMRDNLKNLQTALQCS